MNEVRSEIRGIRLIVGAFVTIWFTYWYITGELFRPFAAEAVCSLKGEPVASCETAYGGPFGDLIDAVAAVFYVVGTVVTWLVTFAWNALSSAMSDVRARMGGARKLATSATAIRPGPSAPAMPAETSPVSPQPPPLTDTNIRELFVDTRDRVAALEGWRDKCRAARTATKKPADPKDSEA